MLQHGVTSMSCKYTAYQTGKFMVWNAIEEHEEVMIVPLVKVDEIIFSSLIIYLYIAKPRKYRNGREIYHYNTINANLKIKCSMLLVCSFIK